MRGTGIFHPDFFYHARPVVESAMLARIEIFEPTGNHSEWVPGVGMVDNMFELRYRGFARIQPNKDWRARPREQALDFDATHAIRVQVGIDTNELTGPEASEDFSFGWRVLVLDSEIAASLEQKDFYVRNATRSSNSWVHNLLCDENMKG